MSSALYYRGRSVEDPMDMLTSRQRPPLLLSRSSLVADAWDCRIFCRRKNPLTTGISGKRTKNYQHFFEAAQHDPRDPANYYNNRMCFAEKIYPELFFKCWANVSTQSHSNRHFLNFMFRKFTNYYRCRFRKKPCGGNAPYQMV